MAKKAGGGGWLEGSRGTLVKRREAMRPLAVALNVIGVLAAAGGGVHACTIGVADGTVTSDGRGLLWKSAMSSYAPAHLLYTSEGTYSYLSIYGNATPSGRAWLGLNSPGLSTGHAAVDGALLHNDYLMGYCLQNCATVDEVRAYLTGPFQTEPNRYSTRGCFTFLDATGDATMFEVDGTQSQQPEIREFDTQNPNRAAQNLLGRVVRANEFHGHDDGTDDLGIAGRYEAGNTNVAGLIAIGDLSARTITQGNNMGPGGFEFLRYGPNRPMEMIAAPTVLYSMVVQGVAPGESPALSTMWTMLGQSNYSIAVPTWVAVADLPGCLSSGDLSARVESLHTKGNEGIVQASTLPFEAHLFGEVEELLSVWRTMPIRVGTVARVEHRMAADAYSLLSCLDETDDDNKAPTVTVQSRAPVATTYPFQAVAADTDGSVLGYEWVFGDGSTSNLPSPSHTYDAPGWYLVSCTVTDDDGVSNTDWKYVHVAFILGPSVVPDGSCEVNTIPTPGNTVRSELGEHRYAGSAWGDRDVTTHWDKDARVWYVTDGGDDAFPDGDFAFRIDARLDLNGADALWQSGIRLEAGTEYVLSFDMWGESGDPILDVTLTGPETLVLFDDVTTLGDDAAAERMVALFTPEVSGSYTLRFFTDVDNGDNHAWIDNVALQSVRPVPEPGTLALLGLAACGLGGYAPKRRRA